MNNKMVSVAAEWVRDLKCLSMILLNSPKVKPIKIEMRPKSKNYPIISKGEYHSNSKSVPKPFTVLKRMMLTMSLNTPSP